MRQVEKLRTTHVAAVGVEDAATVLVRKRHPPRTRRLSTRFPLNVDVDAAPMVGLCDQCPFGNCSPAVHADDAILVCLGSKAKS